MSVTNELVDAFVKLGDMERYVVDRLNSAHAFVLSGAYDVYLIFASTWSVGKPIVLVPV